ncbi:hypothetical protein DH2020_027896 [Rehmannia glutinosa]|uniref:CCHC-type domain-containing protein n=1 Tax=Rehmannia glutinosa TaxID=99300 RepID=A0ABR0VTT8_REHGL
METPLEDLYERMRLEEEEENGLVIEQEESDESAKSFQWCLAGRFLTNRSINFLAMKNTLASLWRPVKGVLIKELGPNMFLFQFFHELDIQRVESNGPWTFDNQLLLTKRLTEGEQPSKVIIFHTAMWVQVFDLPIGFMTERVCINIGNFIGSFLESDPKNFQGGWKNYLRIRVSLDTRNPIKRRMKIKKTGGEWAWINFKYERLPSFCFLCGRLGHSEKFCEKLYDSITIPVEKPYGIWLRASNRRFDQQGRSQWLRETPSEFNSGKEQDNRADVEMSRAPCNEEAKNAELKNKEKGKGVAHGGNLGMVTTTYDSGDHIFGNPIFVHEDFEEVENEGLTFSDIKRRRVEDNSENNRDTHGPVCKANDSSAYISTPQVEGLENINVCSLMKTDSVAWDVDLLIDIFNARDVSLICKIPLPNSPKADSWIWTWDSNGVYTVKSGYRKLCEGLSSYRIKSILIGKVLGPKVPPKAKHMVWKACQDILPFESV